MAPDAEKSKDRSGAVTPGGLDPKPDWRGTVKESKRQGAKAPAQQTARLSVRVSEEAYQRLFVASVMGKVTASEILDRLIRDPLPRVEPPGEDYRTLWET
jgi:hypothetical protein